MRASIFKDSPDYSDACHVAFTKVCVDGIQQSAAVAFDDVEGWLDRYTEPTRITGQKDEIQTERVYGKITFEWAEMRMGSTVDKKCYWNEKSYNEFKPRLSELSS